MFYDENEESDKPIELSCLYRYPLKLV